MRSQEAKRACNKRWAEANPDKARAASAKWRAANREKKRAESAEYRRNNPEKMRALVAAWWKRHPDKGAEYAAAWRRRHPEKASASLRESHAKRRAAVVSAAGSHTARDVSDCLTSQGHRCFYCLTSLVDGYHVDHMTPLSRGGSNGPENIVCACPQCNFKKNRKTAAEFILGRKAA